MWREDNDFICGKLDADGNIISSAMPQVMVRNFLDFLGTNEIDIAAITTGIYNRDKIEHVELSEADKSERN